ncbi:uncharacterized protein LACBIDRAFT_334324 [Laccaria bicolor S238N-H82]|uniref:Predicted protein n=1 Tax=Laccaria bicolor (strain S238N-H82 / ATCC MYA-4686) TaxID=486041 RepID=B0DYU9_LACBS|nr:uncharacterized protein LACBIDRAFT_334324 [Laccaria bicolor S238N-H82]EDR00203.1 predicted protein [Laccaria bicolor S238N-H82]|eukprot:XP_001889112.1 predicted protein [Laccaria bicolor S238N-H82]
MVLPIRVHGMGCWVVGHMTNSRYISSGSCGGRKGGKKTCGSETSRFFTWSHAILLELGCCMLPPAICIMKHSRDAIGPEDSDLTARETIKSSSSNASKDIQGEIKVGNTIQNSKYKCMILPWEEYKALTEGGLVIFTISIHTFIMPIKDNQGNFTGGECRVYQLNMHSILIVDESDAEPEPRYKPYTSVAVVWLGSG